MLDQFEENVIAECIRPDGRLICLSNDIAQSVTYYNKPLMDEFGYEVPTTWEELAALGEKLAVEHPGYLIGAFGDALSLDMYFWTARCATGQLQGENTVYINVLAPECVRAAQWVDRMQEIGAWSPRYGTFDPAVIDAANQDMLLILTAPSWFGEFVFGGQEDSVYYTESNGQLACRAAAEVGGRRPTILRWPGWCGLGSLQAQREPWARRRAGNMAGDSGRVPGGPRPDLSRLQATGRELGAARSTSNPLYANDPGPVYIESAAYEDPLFGIVTYDTAIDLPQPPSSGPSTTAGRSSRRCRRSRKPWSRRHRWPATKSSRSL